MDEEFDTSIDTSSFDDVTPDTSDVGSFDDASDIVSVMDEAMDTSSFGGIRRSRYFVHGHFRRCCFHYG